MLATVRVAAEVEAIVSVSPARFAVNPEMVWLNPLRLRVAVIPVPPWPMVRYVAEGKTFAATNVRLPVDICVAPQVLPVELMVQLP